jgi:hypothetical protein
LGMGGMEHSNISHVFAAVMHAKDLHELRACGELPFYLGQVGRSSNVRLPSKLLQLLY